MMEIRNRLKVIAKLAYFANDTNDQILLEDVETLIQEILKPLAPVSGSFEVTLKELQIAKESGKVAAIKAYRKRTGRDLKESKDAVEGTVCWLGISFFVPEYVSQS